MNNTLQTWWTCGVPFFEPQPLNWLIQDFGSIYANYSLTHKSFILGIWVPTQICDIREVYKVSWLFLVVRWQFLFELFSLDHFGNCNMDEKTEKTWKSLCNPHLDQDTAKKIQTKKYFLVKLQRMLREGVKKVGVWVLFVKGMGLKKLIMWNQNVKFSTFFNVFP